MRYPTRTTAIPTGIRLVRALGVELVSVGPPGRAAMRENVTKSLSQKRSAVPRATSFQ